MNVGFAGLLLTLIFAGVNSYSAEAPCYPGLDCGALREPGQTAVPLVGDALPGFRFTQNFVLDGAQNLVWARDLFAAGNTMQRFAEAYGGRETFSTAYSRMRSDISQLKLGAIAGWRLATQAEVDRLMERLSPPTIYAYFRPRASGLPTRNVVGVLEPGANNDSVKAAGVLYSNSLLGRAKPRDVAGAQLNPYGFWIVRDITRQVEQTEGLRAEGLLQYFEPVETMRVQPIGMFRAHKSANGVDISDGLTESVALSVKPTEEIRSITLYNLRPIPRGALVSAEVAMRGLSASGSPTPSMRASPWSTSCGPTWWSSTTCSPAMSGTASPPPRRSS